MLGDAGWCALSVRAFSVCERLSMCDLGCARTLNFRACTVYVGERHGSVRNAWREATCVCRGYRYCSVCMFARNRRGVAHALAGTVRALCRIAAPEAKSGGGDVRNGVSRCAFPRCAGFVHRCLNTAAPVAQQEAAFVSLYCSARESVRVPLTCEVILRLRLRVLQVAAVCALG